MIIDLLDNKRFQQYWLELVLKNLQNDSSNISSTLITQLINNDEIDIKNDCCKKIYYTNLTKVIIKSLNELSSAINLAIETFMHSCKNFF